MCLNCHVVTIDAVITNLDALKAACQRLGWEFAEGEQRHHWYGRWVDDTPTPRNLFATEEEYQQVVKMARADRQRFMTERLNRCDHVIRVPGCTYEVGVFQVGESWQLSYDYIGDVAKVLGTPAGSRFEHVTNPLPQAYALEWEKLQAQALGYQVAETVEQDGTVQLTLTSYS
jgi:hypothetical protein